MRQIIAIIDGTLSRLETGHETHAGKLFKLALRLPPQSRQIFYDPGVQGFGLEKWLQVASGTGLNLSIENTYRKISQHYQAGDKLYLFGYSRGAYAVRLIAGMINQFGLLQSKEASFENARMVLNYYNEFDARHAPARAFREQYCRPDIPVDFLGVWDTVKALGLRFPFFHHLSPMSVKFKDSRVPENVRHAAHALARDEDRWLYEPEFWFSASPNTKMKQVIFAGDHAVVGGQIIHKQMARQLGNISFLWMMEEARQAGFELIGDWQNQFPTDVCAPLHDRRQWWEYLWLRQPRSFTPAEYFHEHPSIAARENC